VRQELSEERVDQLAAHVCQLPELVMLKGVEGGFFVQ